MDDQTPVYTDKLVQMVHICPAKITTWANVIRFMMFRKKVSVISHHPLHVELICLDIWKFQIISNNLMQSKNLYDLYTPEYYSLPKYII